VIAAARAHEELVIQVANQHEQHNLLRSIMQTQKLARAILFVIVLLQTIDIAAQNGAMSMV